MPDLSVTSLTFVLQGVGCILEAFLPMPVCAWLLPKAVHAEYDRVSPFASCFMLLAVVLD